MAFLTDADRAKILDAVKRAEQRTSAELVTVIARSSDTYLVVPLLIAAAAALILPGILWLLDLAYGFGTLYVIQLVTFAVLALLLQWQEIAVRLVPSRIKEARAERRAREQFLLRGLHRTATRAGVLLFVSVREHHVEIIADEGIAARVPQDTWDAIVAAFTGRVRQGDVAGGFVAAIDAIAAILAQHFPRAPDDRNELPDRLVELDWLR
jgi:putative membrane protein